MNENLRNRKDEEAPINIKKAWDLNYWCDELNLKAEELVEIVKKVGPFPHDIRVYIAKRHLNQWTTTY